MSFSTELERNHNTGGDAKATCVYLGSLAAVGSEHSKASVGSEKQIEADGSSLFILAKKPCSERLYHNTCNSRESSTYQAPSAMPAADRSFCASAATSDFISK